MFQFIIFDNHLLRIDYNDLAKEEYFKNWWYLMILEQLIENYSI